MSKITEDEIRLYGYASLGGIEIESPIKTGKMNRFKFGDKVIYCGEVGIFWEEIPESVAAVWILLEGGLQQCFINDLKPLEPPKFLGSKIEQLEDGYARVTLKYRLPTVAKMFNFSFEFGKDETKGDENDKI